MFCICPSVNNLNIIAVYHMPASLTIENCRFFAQKICIQGQERSVYLPTAVIILYDVYSFVNTGLGTTIKY